MTEQYKVIQGHRLLLRSKAHILHTISDQFSSKLYLTQFPTYTVANSIENHPTPVWAPDQGDPFRIS